MKNEKETYLSYQCEVTDSFVLTIVHVHVDKFCLTQSLRL